MQHKLSTQIVLLFSSMTFVMSACATAAPVSLPTETARPTATHTLVPTITFTPTRTPGPTSTPNMTATQKAENYRAEIQSYFDRGYLDTTQGSMDEVRTWVERWAQLDWYSWKNIGVNVDDFFVSAHFEWSSAYRNASDSGCGFAFAIQEDDSHYAVFLDRAKIIFLDSDRSKDGVYARRMDKTRGSGTVKFDNPFDHPVQADFTLIVNGTSAYVLVDQEFIGQYTLSQSRILRGDIGLSLLSGTNRDFGTRCAMSNIHLWTPE